MYPQDTGGTNDEGNEEKGANSDENGIDIEEDLCGSVEDIPNKPGEEGKEEE